MVRNFGELYKKYIPVKDRQDVFSAIFEHDTLEDTDCSFDELVNITNYRVATIVNAVTTTKSGSRKERFSDEYYDKIKNTKYATFVKLCDRIANVKYGVDNNNPIIKMYQKEHDNFKKKLYVQNQYEELWSYLDKLIEKEKTTF
jgi:(p)ppGpp synthase/HD superfamily hydrolase